jgi:RNA polymerase sigma-70 factor, ECF subfamily
MNIVRTRKGLLSDSKDEHELSELMRESQNGNSDAYNRLLTRISEMLKGYVRKSVAQDQVDDVLQEIILGVHLKRHTFNSEQFFLPWLYAIARYKVIDFLRSKGRNSRLVFTNEDLDLLAVSDVEMVVDSVSVDNLQQLISDLPEKQLTIVKTVKIDGLSIKEAALKLGFSESDVKVNIHRALKTLKAKFENRNAL